MTGLITYENNGYLNFMKKRLLVMNGQKLVQNDSTGEWKTEKVSKAQGVEPGIYNLYNAVNADILKDNIGEVIHIDKKENVLYQKNKLQYIKHDLTHFDQIPETGLMMNIKYENNKANTAEVSQKRNKGIKL